MPDKQTDSRKRSSGQETKAHTAETAPQSVSLVGEGLTRDTVELSQSRPELLSPRDMIALQRNVGNRVLARMIQPRPILQRRCKGTEAQSEANQDGGVTPVQTVTQSVQRETVQRFMSAEDWKKHSSKTFGRRSSALKRIDALVAQYNAIPKTATEQRMQALTALNQAISDWQAKKGGSSGRKQAIADLLRDVDVEFLALTMEMEQGEKSPSDSPPPEPEVPLEDSQETEEEADEEAVELDEELSPEEANTEAEDIAAQDELDREELENLRALILAQRAIIQGLKTRQEMARQMPPDQVADLLDEIHEQIETSNRIGEALSRPLKDVPGEDESLEAELQELLQGMESEDDHELRALEVELEAEEAQGGTEFGSGFEVDDPEDIADELAEAEDELRDLEGQARTRVLMQAQEGKIIAALLPLFMKYKTKKDEHGAHGIKSEVVQQIINDMMGKSEFLSLYELNAAKGDIAIQKAAEMAFGDTWTLQVADGYLSVLNIDADAALKQLAAPVRTECERIVKANKEQLSAAFEVLAQAQLEAKKSGERSFGSGPVSGSVGGSVEGYIGAKGTAKASAEINKLARSIKLVAEASAQAGMGADMAGFIRAGIGKDLEVSAEANLSAFFGIKGSVSALFEATLTQLRAEGQASAMAGAEVSGNAKAGLRYKHVEGTLDAEGEALAGAKADVSGSVVMGLEGISIKGSAEAFAGVKASGSLGASVGYKGKRMFSVRAKASATAGAGASASGEFTFHQGKLKISGEVGMTLGVGGEMGTEVEVDFKVIGEAVLAQMKEFYDMIFPPDIDRRSPSGPRDTGLTSEERGKLYMAVYPAFSSYGQRKQKRGEHGVKREVLQQLLDKNVILNKTLVREEEQDGITNQIPLYTYAEADGVLIYAALSALSGQLNSIDIQAGQIRSMDAVSKENYVGMGT